MAPLRRYLRISKCHILETHIYTEPPSLQQWLLNPRDPMLPKIINHIKPEVVPLVLDARENDIWNSKRKPGPKKPTVVTTADYEVAITLLPTTIRHSVLQKHKHITDKAAYKLQSAGKGLIAQSRLAPIEVDDDDDDDDDDAHDEPSHTDNQTPAVVDDVLILQESDDDGPGITAPERPQRRSKRTRDATTDPHSDPDPDSDSDSDSNPSSSAAAAAGKNCSKRARQLGLSRTVDADDKKKITMDVSYEGFAVYGHILCLVVRRPPPSVSAVDVLMEGGGGGRKKRGAGRPRAHEPGAMETWLAMQMRVRHEEEDE